MIASAANALVLVLAAIAAAHLCWRACGFWAARREAGLADTVLRDGWAKTTPSGALISAAQFQSRALCAPRLAGLFPLSLAIAAFALLVSERL
jgi:hypothetical protein